jgi:broad specificity phosphatase PhoE
MTTFYLIRHAECDGVGEVLWGRSPDVHLNDTGKRSARQLAERLTELELHVLYSSPLERAVETANEIVSGVNLPVQMNETFNEIDFGEWTGESIEQLANEPLWQEFNVFRGRTLIPGGESIPDAQDRVVAELKRLAEQHAGQHVAVVTHAEIIRIGLSYFNGTSLDEWYRIDVPPCSINLLVLDEHSV